MAALACLAVFFFVVSLTYDGTSENSWTIGAIAAAGTGLSMVLLRRVLVRRNRVRELAAKRFSQKIMLTGSRVRPSSEKKLTVERNNELVAEIRKRSDAAKILNNVADAHQEIIELCEAYLQLATREIANAHVGSPRLPAIRKGAAFASRRHRYHILKWAEIKAKNAGIDNRGTDIKERMTAAENALTAVDRALRYYPEESALSDSRRVLLAFLASGTLKSLVIEAETAENNGNIKGALALYNSAVQNLNERESGLANSSAVRSRLEKQIKRLEERLGM